MPCAIMKPQNGFFSVPRSHGTVPAQPVGGPADVFQGRLRVHQDFKLGFFPLHGPDGQKHRLRAGKPARIDGIHNYLPLFRHVRAVEKAHGQADNKPHAHGDRAVRANPGA